MSHPERTAKFSVVNFSMKVISSPLSAADVKIKGKEGKVIYTVKISRPYRLDSITVSQSARQCLCSQSLRTLKEESLLKTRQRYDLARMQAEQERIEEALENYGFYYFDDRFLIFEADSTVGKRKVNLDLKLEPGIPRRARRIYKINEVTIFPNYSLTDTLKNNADTTIVDSFNYVDSVHNFRPRIITRVINIKKGNTYSREDQELTLSHLMGLGVFKFVNIKFSEAHADSSLLNANIYLTPLQKKSLRAEVQAVSKSNNFVGPGISFTFTNRNLFRGAELLSTQSYRRLRSSGWSSKSGTFKFFGDRIGIEPDCSAIHFSYPDRLQLTQISSEDGL